ncbi:YheC/YheD family protein [Cohnella soli]|uniref:YheC/YheD family protein n=1 Tax=Cohnella soli TaxID=425005 RepID=A0ABW0I0U0_9BACL
MGKWQLHRFYWKDGVVRNHLPATAIYGRSTLERFLNRHKGVYIKPNYEHQGIGIIKAWKKKTGSFTFVKVRGSPSSPVSTPNELYRKLNLRSKQSYVVQKAIPLARVNGRVYDIRVMMMRLKGRWTYAGMLAKVAGSGSVITNVRRGGGHVLSIPTALHRSKQRSPERKMKLLKSLSYRICRRFDSYKYTRQIGIDYGIEPTGKIWVIEVNFDFPSHALFAKLKDKSQYRKIKSIASTWRKRKRK